VDDKKQNPGDASLRDDAASGSQLDDSRPGRTRSGKRRSRPIAAAALGLLAAVVLVSGVGFLAWQRRASRLPTPDFGSLPENSPTGYSEISGAVSPAKIGGFSNSTEDGKPLHLDSSIVWLGSSGSEGPEDGIALVLEEGGAKALLPCTDSTLVFVISVGDIDRLRGEKRAYLNLFADWNRDGRFGGADECAKEWAIENYPVDLASAKAGDRLFVPVHLKTGEQTLQYWQRAVVTAGEPADIAHSAPYRAGESEDTFVDAISSQKRPGSCSSSPVVALKKGFSGPLVLAAFPPEAAARPIAVVGDSGGASLDLSHRRIGGDKLAVQIDTNSPDLQVGSYGDVVFGEPGSAPRSSKASAPQAKDPGGGSCRFVIVPPDIEQAPEEMAGDDIPQQRQGTATLTFAVPSSRVAVCGDSWSQASDRAYVPVHYFESAEPTLAPTRAIVSVRLNAEGSTTPTLSAENLTASPVSSAQGRGEGRYLILGVPSSDHKPAQDVEVIVEVSLTRSATPNSTDTAAVSTWRCIGVFVAEIGPAGPGFPANAGAAGAAVPDESTDRAAPGSSAEPYPAQRPPNRIAGDYDVAFSKKSDSCGKFELRWTEHIRIRQYGERIEVQRDLGNLSQGTVSTTGSFRATGSGNAKDGSSYIESYTGKTTEAGFLASYDVQLGDCRASFDLEATRR
jgi:hypothetical protein